MRERHAYLRTNLGSECNIRGGLTLGGERTRKHVCSGLAANPGLYALGGAPACHPLSHPKTCAKPGPPSHRAHFSMTGGRQSLTFALA